MTRVPLWVQAVAGEMFRAALVADPLRALADAAGVVASAEQARRLEEMTATEREDLLRGILPRP